MRRALLSLAVGSVLVAATAAGSACGGSSAQQTPRAVKALRATSNAFRFGTELVAPSTTLAAAATALDDAIRHGASIRAHLDDLANSNDALGLALTRAFCTGLNQLAAFPEDAPPPSQTDWSAFLVEQLAILAPNNPYAAYQRVVDQFTTTVDLAQIHPRLAAAYVQQCGRAR